jgi:hypothetical protein
MSNGIRSNDPSLSSWSELTERFDWKPLDAAIELAVVACVLVIVAVGAFWVPTGKDAAAAEAEKALSACGWSPYPRRHS